MKGSCTWPRDYSGDILFDERRYPGTLARIIALDAAFRIDTNANCLDNDIVDMLLGSRLFEIESVREQGS